MPKFGEELQRILDVIQEDITRTTSESRRDLLTRAYHRARLTIEFGIDGDGKNYVLDRDQMHDAFFRIASNPPVNVDEESPVWLSFLQIREQMLLVLESIFNFKTEDGGGIIKFKKVGGLSWSTDGLFSEYSHPYVDNQNNIKLSIESYRFDWEPQKKEDITIRKETYRLLEELIALPANHLKKCPECKNFFVQQTKRKKKFCSTKCRNKFNIKDNYLPKAKRG